MLITKLQNATSTSGLAGSSRSTTSTDSFQRALEQALSGTGSASTATPGLSVADRNRAAREADAAALAEFREYMSKTPEQRMREAILKEMGLTEEDLKAMPAEKCAAIEKAIAAKIRERLEAQEQIKANALAEKVANSGDTQLIRMLSV
ncbi:hypothetical protein Q9Q94_07260 [Uliginosibacterium sp. 31-16]|uniref:hypothetical protein n=1 Tax=Uliginosibacterium sp. 31-16 TaxID=3068315 RepID=UPI00273D1514|nr:hypothetical protein [Uliginosibacterium sp. 31-16]MDP5239322.1 hypothetical protein [Uliginosibacterium sp. 31-16]